jgi:pimeloyl-ACP methyl ester carboxylesterase
MHSFASVFSIAILCTTSAVTSAQAVPAAIFTDPPADAAHPAQMSVLHIPSHGVEINGLLYAPSGAGQHPTLIICHGLPGNEKNLDLAQAVRRAGWNAVTFNYRGSWGSPGNFRFAQNLQDADAVLAFLRAPSNAAEYGIDTRRIVIAGHSMGGWVTAHTASHDHNLIGAILISAADMSHLPGNPAHPKLVSLMADDMESLNGVTAAGMADEVTANVKTFELSGTVDGLSKLPLLVLSADDGLAPTTDALVAAIKAKASQQVTAIHAATDHGWSDHRIYLESTIINWLAELK